MNQFKKILIVVSVLLYLGLQGVHAQTMYVNLKNGSQTSYETENIRKVNFSENKIVINKLAANSDTLALTDLRSLTFTEFPIVTEPGIVTKDGFLTLGGDTIIKLIVDDYRGNLQWQKTLDNVNWIDIEGETLDTLSILSGTEAMYRAQIVEGDCLPVYSDSAIVVTNNPVASSYIEPADLNLSLISDSTSLSNGDYIYIGANQGINIEPGQVIIEEQTGGTIRKITGIRESGDTVFVKTVQATMEDIFYNTSFKLSSEMIVPAQNMKSASMAEIQKVLTDKDGFIHPVEVTYYSKDGTILKSASVFSETGDTQNESFYIHENLSNTSFFNINGSFEIKDRFGNARTYNGIAKAGIKEGHFTFNPEFKFEFDYKAPQIEWDWGNTKYKTGELNKFKFYTDSSHIDFNILLDFEFSVGIDYGREWTLIENMYKRTQTFIVPVPSPVSGVIPVPVWIDYTIDLKHNLKFVAESGFKGSMGYKNTNYITIGAAYENKEWSLINDIEKNSDLTYIITQLGKMGVRYDIYPSCEIKLYSAAGPYLKVGPYLNAECVQSVNLNWNKLVNLGGEANVGVSAEVLGKGVASFNAGNWSIFNKNFFQSPLRISIVSGNNQRADTSAFLPHPLVIKVQDSRNVPVEDVQVYFELFQKGTVEISPAMTNSKGLTEVKWKLSDKEGLNSLKVFIKDGKDNEIAGSIVAFATSEVEDNPELPTVKTALISEISQNFAISGGNVTKDGGAEITARGVCWSLTPNPTTTNSKTSDGTGTGEYQSTLTGLYSDTAYFVRAYAINSVGIAYGNEYSFRTQKVPDVVEPDPNQETGELVYGGKTYKTVKIGEQWWMAENMAFNLGSSVAIPPYGNFYTATDAFNVCPSGWHLPSSLDWNNLVEYISAEKGPFDYSNWDNYGAREGVGGHLKSISGWNKNGNGTDDYNFNGLPSGAFLLDENDEIMYKNEGEACYWWSSTHFSVANSTFFRSLTYTSSRIHQGGLDDSIHYKLNVRCVKDQEDH